MLNYNKAKRTCLDCGKTKSIKEFPPSLTKQAIVTGTSCFCKDCYPDYVRRQKERSIQRRLTQLKKKYAKQLEKVKKHKAIALEIFEEIEELVK